MPNIVPGVRWQPIAIDYSKRARRRKGRGLIGHVAVSTSKNLTPSPTGNSWTFYLPKYEPAIQYIDLDFVSGSSKAGDATCATFESEGGMGNDAQVNGEPWTDNQLNWAAHILRYMHDTEGVPLQVMPDSRPESRGFATHRLGVDPWRVAGGESWTSSRGKLCPGDTKHAQRFEIVRRAAGGANLEDDMTPEEHQMLKDVLYHITPGEAGKKGAGVLWSAVASQSGQVASLAGQVSGLQAALTALAKAPSAAVDLDAVFKAAQDGARSIVDNLEVVARPDA